jgi:hypothetical protein
VKSKEFFTTEEFVTQAVAMLDSIQDNLPQRAAAFRDANTAD